MSQSGQLAELRNSQALAWRESTIETRSAALAKLIMQDIPSHELADRQSWEANRFSQVTNGQFTDICSSHINITWSEHGSITTAPVIYFAIMKANNVSQTDVGGDSMHTGGSFLKYLVNDCHVNLDELFTVDYGYGPIHFNALSFTLLPLVKPVRREEISIIPVLSLLLDLGASPNVPFVYHDNYDSTREMADANGHSLLHVAFQHQKTDIANILFSKGARFNRDVDPSPMTTALKWNNAGDIVHMFLYYRSNLSPDDIATNGAFDGTPLHILAAKLQPRETIDELVDILVKQLGISPYMVDSQGRTALDIATRCRQTYIQNNIPILIGRAEHMMRILNVYMVREDNRHKSVAALHGIGSTSIPAELHNIILRHSGLQNAENTARAVLRARAAIRGRASAPPP